MAIPEYKNGHFKEMAAWSQTLQIVGNSTLSYHLTPMTALGPSSYKNGNYFSPHLLVCPLSLFSAYIKRNVKQKLRSLFSNILTQRSQFSNPKNTGNVWLWENSGLSGPSCYHYLIKWGTPVWGLFFEEFQHLLRKKCETNKSRLVHNFFVLFFK